MNQQHPKPMSEQRCLYCYQPLSAVDAAGKNVETSFHERCSKRMFGAATPPILDYTNDQMLDLAQHIIQSQVTVTGVQPKLSLGLAKNGKPQLQNKLSIMGVWGEYILKPPTTIYRELPELEDVTMHLASIAGLQTVPHTLIRLASGELAYLTKRIDRAGRTKFAMEDMCQLTERLTEAKYRGSYEQIGKAIANYSAIPGLDIINFFEVVVFSFLTGNNDMHMKNFSLWKGPSNRYQLSPAYDLVAAALVVEGDDEELALNLDGRKKRLTRKNFNAAMQRFNLDQRSFDNIFSRFAKALPKWHDFLELSFISAELKASYHAMLDQKAAQINL